MRWEISMASLADEERRFQYLILNTWTNKPLLYPQDTPLSLMGMKLIVDLWTQGPELHPTLSTEFTHRGTPLEFNGTVSWPLKTFFTDKIVCISS